MKVFKMFMFAVVLVVVAIYAWNITNYFCEKKEENSKEKSAVEKENVEKDNLDIFEYHKCKTFSLKKEKKYDIFFYRVKKGDNLSRIVDRIKKECGPKFSYLDYYEYQSVFGFNIPDTKIFPDFLLVIPLEKNKRIISKDFFLSEADKAIEEMKEDSYYGKRFRKFFKTTSKEELKGVCYAYAMSESELGIYALNRWEKRWKAYSFTYFHILMGVGSPGFKARIRLGLSEGDVIMSPKNSIKLFIAYWFEKDKKSERCLILSEDNYKKCGTKYNGKESYYKKLKDFHLQY